MTKPKTTRKPKAVREGPGNTLLEAFEAFAVARANCQRAMQEALEAKQALLVAQESLSGLGIYVSLQPPSVQSRLAAEEDEADKDESTGIYIPAVGPATVRSPDEEVAKIRSASYGVEVKAVDPNDSSALAHSVGATMESLMKGLGRNLTVGPEIPGQPVASSAVTPANPHEQNKHGGPVEQRPVE